MLSNSYDAFVQELNAAYATEQLLVEAQEEMLPLASDTDLYAALETHLEETRQHVSRLDGVFELLELTPEGGCATASTLVDEVRDNVQSAESPEVADVAIVNGVIKAEYLELATYSALRQALTALQLSDEVAEAIDSNMQEDRNALQIAENSVQTLLVQAN